MSDLTKPLISPIITGRPDQQPKIGGGNPAVLSGGSFQEILERQIAQNQPRPQQLSFSKHAQTRTEQRGIELSGEDIQRLDTAVGKAQEKGITDTLVFMNNTAFIVNVPSRVVVTVVDGNEETQNVFTNIDGAVIA